MRDGAQDLAGTSAAIPLPAPPDALAHTAWQLEPPMSFERSAVLRPEAAHLVDRLLARVARGRGALDVTMGEILAVLAEGDRALRLGYSGIGDYARERLGVAGRTAQAMARLARKRCARGELDLRVPRRVASLLDAAIRAARAAAGGASELRLPHTSGSRLSPRRGRAPFSAGGG